MPTTNPASATLFAERNPFPAWFRRIFPIVERFDQNPLFAADHDFRTRQRARRGWIRNNIAILTIVLILASNLFWGYNAGKIVPGIVFVHSALFWFFIYFFRWKKSTASRAYLSDPRLHLAPITAADFLDFTIAQSMLSLPKALPLFFLASVLCAVCAEILIPSWFPLKWLFVCALSPLILVVIRLFIWAQVGAVAFNTAKAVAMAVGKKARNNRIMIETSGRAVGILFLSMVAIIPILLMVIYIISHAQLSAFAIAVAMLTVVLGFIAWQIFFFDPAEMAAQQYRWAEAILREAIPISNRQHAGDTIDFKEIELLLELCLRPVRSA